MSLHHSIQRILCAYCLIVTLGQGNNQETISKHEKDPAEDGDQPKVEGEAEAVTMHICPNFCTIGEQILCRPPPCPQPDCVDPARYKPTECCVYCPNGPDCRAPDGNIVLYNHWKIVGGNNCTCLHPGRQTTCTS